MCQGHGQGTSQRALYLFRAQWWLQAAVGMQLWAAHGHPGASYDEVAMATPVFGSADENILTEGTHEWHWHACMLQF